MVHLRLGSRATHLSEPPRAWLQRRSLDARTCHAAVLRHRQTAATAIQLSDPAPRVHVTRSVAASSLLSSQLLLNPGPGCPRCSGYTPPPFFACVLCGCDYFRRAALRLPFPCLIY
eukprot:scaffold6781_cov107-Isochrysis_galbana.AAC.4